MAKSKDHSPRHVSRPVPVPPVRTSGWWITALVAVISFAMGAAGVWMFATSTLPTTPGPVRTFQLLTPGQIPSTRASAISPDGRMVAYVADGRLWLRRLDTVEAHMISGADGAVLPFWSPGSDTIGYFNTITGTLNAAPVTGDSAVVLCTLPTRGVYGGAVWGPDDRIIFSQGPLGLLVVAKPEGNPTPFLRVDAAQNDAGFYAPQLLPDGRTVVFSVWKKDGAWSLDAIFGDTRTALIKAPPGEILTGPVYAPSGHLLYNRVNGGSQSIWAVPFSWETLTVGGAPFQVASRGGWPGVSSDHTLVYSITEGQKQEQMVWINRDGSLISPVGQPHERITTPAISPDDGYIVVSGFDDGQWDIWTHDTLRGTKTRVTFDAEQNTHPVWSSDGDRIAFVVNAGTVSHIVVVTPDGSQNRQQLVSDPVDDLAPDWSRDGYYMAYQALDEESGGLDLWYIPLEGPGAPVRFTETPYDEALPQFSPDGRYLAYQSDKTGRWEVYVTRFPEGGAEQKISFRGGVQPRWSYWSEELFYIRDDNLMAVRVRTEPRFSMLGSPVRLFQEDALAGDQLAPAYDVTSDGQRFVVVRQGVDTNTSIIIVVENWLGAFEGK